MPLTPSHLGAGLFLGTLGLKFLNFWGLIFGSVVMDFENVFWTIYNRLNGCPYCDHHGFFHSIAGAVVGSLILAFLIVKFKEPLNRISLRFKIEQSFSFPVVFFSSLLGWVTHIIFDSFVHDDVFLFWPLKVNPFLVHWNLYWPLSWFLASLGGLAILVLTIRYFRKTHDQK